MEKLKEYFLIGGIIIFAVALYVFMPEILGFFIRNCKGSKGLLFLAAVCIVLITIYFLFGYRKSDLLKIALLILFIAAMIWIYFNYRDLDQLISGRYGQGIATLVFLAIIFLVWLFSRFLT